MNSDAFQRNIFWFAVAIAVLAAAFLFRAPYVAYSVYAFLLLVGLAHVSSVLWLSGLDCTRTVSQTTLQQGDEIDVEVTIENRRGWPIPWIFFEDLYPADFPCMGDNRRLAVLMPGRVVKLYYKLTCPRRGYHRIGPLVMESGDLFGLQRRFRTGVQQNYISVLPTVAYIETFNIASRRPQGPVKMTNRIYEDPSRIASVREYMRGDPMNRIHWKASARTGELFTKTLEATTVTGGTMILDLHELSYKPEHKEERMELAITVTASIAYLLQASGEQAGMLTNAFDAAIVAEYDIAAREMVSREDLVKNIRGDEISDAIRPLLVPTLKSPMQAQKIAENLARVVPGHGLDIDQLVLAEFRGLPRDASLLPVVPLVTERFALTLAEMKHSGFGVSVFLINDRVAYEEAAALLAPHQIHVFHITHERDLHDISPARIGH
jgi:uncharacterized protein (DUF58 family)